MTDDFRPLLDLTRQHDLTVRSTHFTAVIHDESQRESAGRLLALADFCVPFEDQAAAPGSADAA